MKALDFTEKLALSYYRTIATINGPHNIFLVQHQETGKIYVKKILDVYSPDIYEYLQKNHIIGTPQIIQIYEEDNQLTVIEEYISGCSLQEKINESCLSEEDILSYMTDLCIILEQLHSVTPAIVHRDIKPSNVIITNYNRAVLLDFNAAKYQSSSTEDTVLLGTQGYAAPEQYGFGASSPQTDIYSLGILLKEMLASTSISSKQLDAIIQKCTQMNQSERYKNIGELKNIILKLSNPDSGMPAEHTPLWFLPPGYRTLEIWKMIIATPVYIFLAWLCLTMKVETDSTAVIWLERFTFFSMIIFCIFSIFNYLNMQNITPLGKSKHLVVRIIGVVLLNIVYFVFAMTCLSFLEAFII